MKFKEFDYTEKKIEVRKMTIGSVVWTIAHALIEKDKKNLEIRIVDCFMGEVEIFNGLDDLMSHEWNSCYEVNVYDWAVMHDDRNDKDYVKIIISDNVYYPKYN